MADHTSKHRPGGQPSRPVPLRELLGMEPAPASSAAPSKRADRAASAPPSAPSSASEQPRPLAVVDGSNVAHAGQDAARLANVILVRDKLVEQGFEPLIVADAALRHQVDDLAGYERLVAQGSVTQAPAGTDADYFILSFAKELGAAIVSNDQFRDRSRQFAEVRNRVIRFMILADEVVFEKRTSKRKS